MKLKKYISADVNGFLCMNHNTAGVVIGWMCGIWSLICFTPLILDYEPMKKRFDANGTDLPQVVSMIFMIAVINLFASISLIVGIIGRRHLFLLPWMFNFVLSIIFCCIMILYLSISTICEKPRFENAHLIIISLGFLIVILIFMFRIICSFYQQLKKEYIIQQQIDRAPYIFNPQS